MKREDVKKQIPGITEEQLNWIMAENGNDVNREKTAAEQYKSQLENAQAQLKTAQDGLAAFDNALNTAILGAKGRSVKAVRALLDLDALKGSKDRSTDISKALEEAAKANPWAFGEAAEGGAGSVHVSSGKEHGTPPAGDVDPVTAAFKKMNPDINIE